MSKITLHFELISQLITVRSAQCASSGASSDTTNPDLIHCAALNDFATCALWRSHSYTLAYNCQLMAKFESVILFDVIILWLLIVKLKLSELIMERCECVWSTESKIFYWISHSAIPSLTASRCTVVDYLYISCIHHSLYFISFHFNWPKLNWILILLIRLHDDQFLSSHTIDTSCETFVYVSFCFFNFWFVQFYLLMKIRNIIKVLSVFN